MTRITQKQLIEQIKTLKEIKPRKEWAVLLKSQILSEKKAEAVILASEVKPVSFMDTISSLFFAPRGTGQRKLAYAFAAILLLVFGVFGFSRFMQPGALPEQTPAALTVQSPVKQDAVALNNLVQVAKNQKTTSTSAIKDISAKAKDLTQNLKNNPAQDPQTMKDIANSLKTLADVPGTDLSANQDVKDLYQAVVQSQIADLSKMTLTDEQNKALDEAKDLYFQGKYTDALEKILLINK